MIQHFEYKIIRLKEEDAKAKLPFLIKNKLRTRFYKGKRNNGLIVLR